jgi:hypothetical protein
LVEDEPDSVAAPSPEPVETSCDPVRLHDEVTVSRVEHGVAITISMGMTIRARNEL